MKAASVYFILNHTILLLYCFSITSDNYNVELIKADNEEKMFWEMFTWPVKMCFLLNDLMISDALENF